MYRILLVLLILLVSGCARAENTPAPLPTTGPMSAISAADATATVQAHNAHHPTAEPTQAATLETPTLAPATSDSHAAGPGVVPPVDGASPPVEDHHTTAGPHLRLASAPQATEEDLRHGAEFIQTARQALEKYADPQVALDEGYWILGPDVPQDLYHFINTGQTMRNLSQPAPDRPTALLYRKVQDDWVWIGAMYSAPMSTPEETLDKIFPRSLARWHAHTNICLPTASPDWNALLADPQFGFTGAIATREACDTAGGRFMEDVLGWMVHVELNGTLE